MGTNATGKPGPYVQSHRPSKPMEPCESTTRGVRFSFSTDGLADGAGEGAERNSASSSLNPHDKSAAEIDFEDLGRRLDRLSSPEPNTGCVIWLGAVVHGGYGNILIALHPRPRRFTSAHRAAWMVEHRREVPDGLLVRHRCDNRWCLNPAHLELGTNQDNMDDAQRRRRTSPTTGGVPRRFRVCALAGCGRPEHARGVCNTHFKNLRSVGLLKVLP